MTGRVIDMLRAGDDWFNNHKLIVIDAIAERYPAPDIETEEELFEHQRKTEAWAEGKVLTPPFEQCALEWSETLVATPMDKREMLKMNMPPLDDITVSYCCIMQRTLVSETHAWEERRRAAEYTGADPEELYWLVGATFWYYIHRVGAKQPNQSGVYVHMYLRGDGTLAHRLGMTTTSVENMEIARVFRDSMPIVVRALHALNNRVPVVYVDKDSYSRQYRRLYQRKHKVEPQSYYWIDIDEKEQRVVREGSGEPRPKGQSQATWVRGHFRHYTEEAPLFGRVVGPVWVNAHQRGGDTDKEPRWRIK